jgi:HEAT repeat protein
MSRRLLCCAFVLALLGICRAFSSPLSAADAPNDEFIQMVVKLIGDPDREFRAAGLEQVRTSTKGAKSTQVFAAQLEKLDASGQGALLSALADRGDAAAKPAVLMLLGASDNENVRAAALASLGTLGTADDVPLLVKNLSGKSSAEQGAARQALARMAGDAVPKLLGAETRSAAPAVKAALIEVLATRRASSETPAIIAAATDENGQVRSAAMNALGQIGKPDQLAQILPGVLKAPKGGERDAAERNVVQICARIGNEDQRGSALIAALNMVDAADRDQLLPLVGRVGGKKLINFVGDIATGEDVARRQIGIDSLSKWPDASVADKLLEIAEKASNPAEREQAFQGYVKVSASRDNRNDKERLNRMKQAMKAARTPEEQLLVINRTRTAYDVESVRFVLPYVDQPQFAQLACETIVEIAHHREVRDPNKAEFDKVLDKVIEVSKDEVVIDRANRYKRGETWERPKPAGK